jgi:hypothetical protein
MKKVNLLTILLVTTVILAIMTMPAMAVSITVGDDDISDWGLAGLPTTTSDWSTANTWVPTVGGVSFFAEDNQDPLNTGAINYNASYIGVHIYGNSTLQGVYREPLLPGDRAEPYGGVNGEFGEDFDIEAMYVTEDSTNIYALVIFSTGMLNGDPYELGDLALDFGPGGGYGYEYGVNLHRVHNTYGQEYGIYATPTDNAWTIPHLFTVNTPVEIDFSVVDPTNALDSAQVDYLVLDKIDHGRTNWAVELAIPKDAVGNPGLPDDPAHAIMKFWITEPCGNDAGPSIPEFLTIAIPVGLLVGLFYVLRRKRQKEDKGE